MTNSSITELDFFQIKDNLKAFLQGQAQFQDYNFEGSNLNVMLDLLAYNTFQNGFFTNMAINEMFLDSAQLRGSAVSHAKALNYLPRSRRSAAARINVSLTVADNPNFVTIPAKTQFVGRCGNETFIFLTDKAYTISPVNGVYAINNVDIYEGRYISEFFVVNASTKNFVLSNANVDTSSIRVFVRPSVDSTTETEYTLKTSIFGVKSDSKVFYVQAHSDDQYEIIFGDDIFGLKPANGNVIRVEYRVSAGAEANGVTTFLASGTISGYAATITLAAASSGGAEMEDLEQIKYFAPRALQIQDRAITESDYEIILKSRFPEIQAISVYGGEELTPPRYGRVVIAVDIDGADGVSESTKAQYAQYLSERSPIGIEPIVTSPQFMFMNVTTTVYYNRKTTAMSESDIRDKVFNAIRSYNTTNLSNFKVTFRSSRLQSAIDSADVNIMSNDLIATPIIPLDIQVGVAKNFDFSFNNPLVIDKELKEGDILSTHVPAIKSSPFKYNGSYGYIQDNGKGKLQIIKALGESFAYLSKDIGTVDYETGRVIISKLIVDEYTGSEIKIWGTTRTPTITPAKGRILSIRDQDVYINVIGVN